jgi:hypothetical protein
MENSPSTTPTPISSLDCEPSTSLDRTIYAMERARILFGGYRRGDANDPEAYVAAIAAVLALYSPGLIRIVTDPRTGISTSEKFRTFMPQSGELKAYCDEQAAIMDRYARLAMLPKPDFRRRLPSPPLANGCRARLFVPAGSPGYEALVKRSQEPNANRLDWKWGERSDVLGIWVSNEWYRQISGRTK